MESFVDFVTDQKIIDILCKKRANFAFHRHKQHQLNDLSSECKIKAIPLHYNTLLSIMPSRRTWVKLSFEKRFNTNTKQNISSVQYNTKTLLLTIKRDRQQHSNAEYLAKLDLFITDLKNHIINCDYTIASPNIIPKQKKKNECRPIACYNDLQDSILLILANKYLTKLFNNFFYEEALAFRFKRIYHGERNVITSHHHSIQRIQEFREKNDKKNIYVAECDIQKFFDVVNHTIVRTTYDSFKNKIIQENPNFSFKEIDYLFSQYLDSYTFAENIASLNNDEQYWAKYKLQGGYFKYINNKDFIKQGVYKDIEEIKTQRIGIPQGGALSGLMANIVLSNVDSILQKHLTDNDLYIRFCDDMILLSTSKQRCKKLFAIYREALTQNKLVYHQPNKKILESKNIAKAYWESKTKHPYKWTFNDKTQREWIGFVGYEIRRDGNVRIRKTTIEKEIKKLKKVAKNLIDKLSNKTHVHIESLRESLKGTLISMSVGRITLWNYKTANHDLCWVNGFKELNANPILANQMRCLDRCRNKVLRKFKKEATELKKEYRGCETYHSNQKKRSWQENYQYYGSPFSYYYHCLIRNKKIDSNIGNTKENDDWPTLW